MRRALLPLAFIALLAVLPLVIGLPASFVAIFSLAAIANIVAPRNYSVFGLDITITAANVLASSTATISKQYNFGATVTAGQAVYLDSSNEWQLLDTNAAATGNGVSDTRGIALNGGASGQPAAVVIEDTAFTPGGTLTNGSAVYGSITAGGVTHDVPATGAYPVYLGQAKSTSQMVLKINASGAVI